MGCFSKPKKDVRLGVSQFVLQTQNVILALLITEEPDPGGGGGVGGCCPTGS